MKTIDLYLGFKIGQWALENYAPESTKNVISHDPEILNEAEKRGFHPVPAAARLNLERRADIAVSIHFPELLSESELNLYESRYNVHPGFLPWGRGYYPVFWALWRDEPAGATLHQMVPALDKGPIVEQIRVHPTDHDTGGSLHQKVQDAERDLIKKWLPKIAAGDHIEVSQQAGNGSYHSRKEFETLKNNPPINSYTGWELFKLVRCLSFPGYQNLMFQIGDERFELSIRNVNQNI